MKHSWWVILSVLIVPAIACSLPVQIGPSPTPSPLAPATPTFAAPVSSETPTVNAPTATVPSAVTAPASPTPSAAGDWSTYSSETFYVRVTYPAAWHRVGEADLRLEGQDGYVGLSALGSTDPVSLNDVCQSQAHHKLLPYGTQPEVIDLQVDGQPACLIMPSSDQDPVMHNLATLIVTYPRPVDRGGGVVDQFLSVDADAAHIRQIADRLSLLPIPAPASAQVAVAGQDGQIRLIDLNLPAANPSLGFPPRGGAVGGTVYALVAGNETRAVKAGANGEEPLSFVKSPNGGFGVWTGDGSQVARLGWSSTQGDISQLFVSAPDGSDVAPVYQQRLAAERNSQLIFEGWARDGLSLYFSEEPFGLGGYILFAGASSLYRLNLGDGAVQPLIAFNPAGGPYICWDDLSSDERLVAGHCRGKWITVLDLTTGQEMNIQPPADAADFGQIGSARFSPDGTRVAFAFARGDSNNEQGWVAVSDALSGGSRVITTSEPGRFFTVLAWLNSETLLLQSASLMCAPDCPSDLWLAKVDGSGSTKVADGVFLGLAGGTP